MLSFDVRSITNTLNMLYPKVASVCIYTAFDGNLELFFGAIDEQLQVKYIKFHPTLTWWVYMDAESCLPNRLDTNAKRSIARENIF